MSDDLMRYLDTLPQRIRAELSGTVHEQAEMLSNAQRQALESLEDTQPSGALAASCTVTPGRDDLEFIVQAGGESTTVEVREGSGQPYDYAEAFEFGTNHQHARPFFWNTYRAKKQTIIKSIASAVQKVLR